MKKAFIPLLSVAAAMFAYARVMIAQAPSESTMGLVFKIFYFHAPAGMMMLLSAVVCGVASGVYLWRRWIGADHVAMAAAELTALFGLIVILTGPLWARRAWGVWWVWDARLTMSLVGWLIAVSYLFVRKYAGPGSDKLAAALAVFGSVNVWRTMHPKTTVVPTLPKVMAQPFWFCVTAMLLLYLLLMTARVHLERQRAALDELYLAEED